MRKRVYIAALIGLFAQWSGNTLLSYYLSDILDMMGWTSVFVKTRINGVFPLCSINAPRSRRRARNLTLDVISVAELLGFHQRDCRFPRRYKIFTTKNVSAQSRWDIIGLHRPHYSSSAILGSQVPR